ncbi:deoxyhypusine hydroxylase [Tilletia horrida]|uniref:Deoxyhypusine hydroxylase n=1 Tax=Tilletia horrida TaxID=155126 RepID=A0AAN6GK84_9BASI|nr:deoxyhypusine hydroxylase [Tilletia horrida]KAK0561271.1 deoxyhypusine hydroxylase [Tilletia horrida]
MTADNNEFASLKISLLSSATPLDARFRALFELRGIASQSQEEAHQAIDIIAQGFQDDSALLKHELAYVLGQIADPYANKTLTSVLANLNEDPMVRHEAAEALGAISSVDSLPILEKYITDSDVSVRETCELAIEKIKYDQSEEAQRIKAAQREKAQKAASAAPPSDTDYEPNPLHHHDQDDDEAFAPIDPAPALSSAALGASTSQSAPRSAKDAEVAAAPVQSLSSDPAHTRTLLASYRSSLLAGDSLSLWERYRAMFSLRNVVHASARAAEKARLLLATSPDAAVRQTQAGLAADWDRVGKEAVLALADGLQDKSALFRHEICFVFGELSHKASIPSMLRVLADSSEHEMVRHEAAEALGGIAEEAAEDADQGAKAEDETSIEDVIKELKRWAEDLSAPRVVRESCIVALDEMAYNNDPTQFQRVDGTSGLGTDVPSLPTPVAAAS